MRITIAGIVAGIIVFCWGAVTHIVLPLGEIGLNIESTPATAAVLETVKGLPESGIYMMPGRDTSITDEDERMQSQLDAWTAGPATVVVLQADGGPTMGAALGQQFLASVLAGCVAAMVLAGCSCGYGYRVMLVGLMGLFTWFNTDASLWIWYGFSNDYTLMTGMNLVAGWLVAGIVLAAIVKPRDKKPVVVEDG